MDESGMDSGAHYQSNRISSEQTIAVIDFMERHPDLANNKLRNIASRQRAKKLWAELTELANSIPGAKKTVDGWIRFWIDKKSMTKAKKKSVDNGTHSSILTPVEERIWTLLKKSGNTTTRKKRSMKDEVLEDDDVEYSSDEALAAKKKRKEEYVYAEPIVNDIEERQTVVMEELVRVMDRQAVALAQVAQASATNAQALEKLAEASLIQARAVESMAGTFSNISAAALDVRNAIINIDYTMKRCYTINQT